MTAHVYAYGRAAWRRRWWAVIAAWILAPVAWAVILQLPERYEASARVLVDTRTALQPVLQGLAVEDDYQARLSVVREALLSRPQLQAVARQTNLDARAKTAAELDAVVTKLQAQLRVAAATPFVQQQNAKTADSIYTITYQHPNREMSIEVVKTLLKNFEEATMAGRRNDSGETQSFLNKQIADLEKRLQEQEARLADFKSRNVGMLPGSGTDYFSRLGAETAGLQQTRTQLAVAMSRQAELQAQLEAARANVISSVVAGTGGSAGAALEVTLQRQDQEKKLADLLVRFTEEWPEVGATRRRIEELKKQEATELAQLSQNNSVGASRPLSMNPLYVGLEAQLKSLQVEIASLRGAAIQHQKEIDKLSKMTNLGPEVEQEFTQLNRDYDQLKKNRQDLVSRSEMTRLAEDAARTGVIKFDVLEPPRAPFEPTWPKRNPLFIQALIVALVAGLVIAILPHLILPTFDEIGALERAVGYPVLGAVSALRSSAQRGAALSQIRHVVIAIAALLVFAGVLLVAGDSAARLLYRLIA